MTYQGTAISIMKSPAFNVCIVNVNNYHQADLIARIKQTEDENISIRDSFLSHDISLGALFRRYGFNYFRG